MMVDPPVFEVYINIEDGVTAVPAAQVSDENIDLLAAVVGGKINEGVLSFEPVAPGFDGAVEIGDYVISDLAGGYVAVDKEMFEAHYVR